MLGPVSISVPTLVIELVIFLATVYLMERLVFSPIREKWAERDRLIQEGLAASTQGRDEVEQARAEVMRILQEARREAQRQIDEVTAAGNRRRDELVAQPIPHTHIGPSGRSSRLEHRNIPLTQVF